MIKRLFYDIEVSPNIGTFWNPGHKISLSYENIVTERAIICICYKWQHEKKVHYLTWDKNQNDKKAVIEFLKVAITADELVGHNGDRFDLVWIRTRAVFHGIPMPPKFQTIDTLKMARNLFRFNSNRLDYLGQFLGLGKKIHTGYDLWKDILLHKSEKAMNKMVKYCKGDVLLLEAIFKRLQTYIPAKTHYGVMIGKDKRTCPECGSNELRWNRKWVSASGTVRVTLRCKDCGKYHTTNEQKHTNRKEKDKADSKRIRA